MGSANLARAGISMERNPRRMEEKMRVMDSPERLVSHTRWN
jgi:hypothetical protein